VKILVVVTLRWAATHHWPQAPLEVAYLKHPHRHEFHIKAKKEVSHADREIEVIQLKQQIINWLEELWPNHHIGQMSCEELAYAIASKFDLASCEVLEDGENGAEVIA
jgi:hypothetical protein